MAKPGMSSAPPTPNRYPYQNELTWSKSKKAIARTAFDAALKRELHQVMEKEFPRRWGHERYRQSSRAYNLQRLSSLEEAIWSGD